jgi:hypothetical protein
LGLACLGLLWLSLSGLAQRDLAWFGFGLVCLVFVFVWLGLVWFVLSWLSLSCFVLAWFCLTLFGLAWFGLVWFCLGWLGSARLYRATVAHMRPCLRFQQQPQQPVLTTLLA